MQCPAGSFCQNTSSLPTECPDGYYSLDCATECTPCPPGYSCSAKDTLPVICDVGLYSPGLSTSCLSCGPGVVCLEGSSANNVSNNICPLGYYCPDGVSALGCPTGTFGNKTGLTDSAECSICPPGFFCPEGTSGYPRDELQCPIGHYCLQGTMTMFEHPCPDGTFSTTFSLEREDQCVVCPAGRYCNGGDGIGGQVCPSGHFCPGNSGNPIACPNGTFTERTGAIDVTNCKLCPAGYYCPAGNDAPKRCPAGTYNPLLGQDNLDDCQLCKAGFACTTIALTQPNELCAAGHYCPEGSDKSADPNNVCPAGTFTDYHNLTAARECSICPAGEACLNGTGGLQTPRLLCASGYFCPNGTEYPTQYPCAPGSYSNATNLQRQEDCELCPPGMFCLGGGSVTSGPCIAGHYCPQGIERVALHVTFISVCTQYEFLYSGMFVLMRLLRYATCSYRYQIRHTASMSCWYLL